MPQRWSQDYISVLVASFQSLFQNRKAQGFIWEGLEKKVFPFCYAILSCNFSIGSKLDWHFWQWNIQMFQFLEKKERKKEKHTISIAYFFPGFGKEILVFFFFFISWFHWKSFSPPFTRRLMKSKTGNQKPCWYSVWGAADVKGFLYLVICKCSSLEQFALSLAREIIDGMQ